MKYTLIGDGGPSLISFEQSVIPRPMKNQSTLRFLRGISFALVFTSFLPQEAQAGKIEWGANVPEKVRCDEQLLAFYDFFREQLGVEGLTLDVLDSLNENGVFGRGTLRLIREIGKRPELNTPKYALLKRSVDFFLDAKNHRNQLLTALIRGTAGIQRPNATYFPCSAHRFGMEALGNEEGKKQLEQRTVSVDESIALESSPLDLILFAPYTPSHLRTDLVFPFQGGTTLSPEASLDASVILHEITHYLDEKLLIQWVNANLKLLKAGEAPDELFLKDQTVAFSDDLSLVEDASKVTVDMGFALIFYEGRGHQVGMGAQLLSLDPKAAKQKASPGNSGRRELASRLVANTLANRQPIIFPWDAAAVQALQKEKAWQSLKGPMARKWIRNGAPAWEGPITEENVFQVSERWAQIMAGTIERADKL